MLFYKNVRENLPTVLSVSGAFIGTFVRTADGKRFELETDDKGHCAILAGLGYHCDDVIDEAEDGPYDYAVIKEGRQRAVKVFDEESMANDYIAGKEGHHIERRERR